MDSKIDITSTFLEKGVDLAKNFLDKLIMPSVEETGLLLKDQVSLFKFKSQVRMLNKAKAYCEKHNISVKTISLKLLCPLLEYSGIEEDETLHDKWAILLSNMVDSEQNIENHVFPYILSQMSIKEFSILEKEYDKKILRVEKLTEQLEAYKKEKYHEKEVKNQRLIEIEILLKAGASDTIDISSETRWKLTSEKVNLNSELNVIRREEALILHKIRKAQVVNILELQEFELSNLIRLGLVKEEKEFYANSQTLEIPKDRDDWRSYITVDLDIDMDSSVENILTELGELFINACKDKTQKSQQNFKPL